MGKTSSFLLAMVAISVGTAFAAGHPGWGRLTGVAILLIVLIGAIAAGALTVRTRSGNNSVRQKGAAQKVSNGLAALSSAAILAVYAAGYYRTGSAGDQFAEKEARRRTPGPIAGSTIAPSAAPYTIEPSRVVPPPPPLAAPTITDPHKNSTSEPAVPLVAKAARDSVPDPIITSPVAEPVTPPSAVVTAAPVAEPSVPPAVAAQVQYKDGTYLGWGNCRHGDIQAAVVIQGGKIVSTSIAQCLTRYSCSWISNLPGQVVSRQSPNVDYVSGATQSTDAFYWAVVDALAKAHE
jgi:uncharacterized protein with FMN-binding domain